jgi:SulP family sulfate permease
VGWNPWASNFIAVRFDGSLNFVNASRFEDVLLEARARNPRAKAVLVIGSGINDIDVTGEERLRDVIDNFRAAVSRSTSPASSRRSTSHLARGRFFDLLSRDNFFKTKEKALDLYGKRLRLTFVGLEVVDPLHDRADGLFHGGDIAATNPVLHLQQ